MRSAETMREAAIPVGVQTTMLAVHVRHATLAANRGLHFAHPLRRLCDDWHFMHNGFMPTAYEALGLPKSVFDSAEYFDYIVPPGAAALDETETLTRLDALPPGGTSGNAFVINASRSYVIHWTSRHTNYKEYFTMWHCRRPGLQIIASDKVLTLAPHHMWKPWPARSVLEVLPVGAKTRITRSE